MRVPGVMGKVAREVLTVDWKCLSATKSNHTTLSRDTEFTTNRLTPASLPLKCSNSVSISFLPSTLPDK